MKTGSTMPSLVLAGNPNVGKSVLFAALTGVYREVANYPGTTVEIATAQWNGWQVMDTPGIYGVSSCNDEERVARDVILDADLIVNVVDGCRLERDLFLTLQLIDMGKPMVVAVNFMDEVEQTGLVVDFQAMAKLLGVPVVPVAAVHGRGMDRLRQTLADACPGRTNEEVDRRLAADLGHVRDRAAALLVLEGDPVAAQRLGVPPLCHREELYQARRNEVDDVVAECVRAPGERPRLAAVLGRAAVAPITGIPILVVVLGMIYQVVGVWVAGDLVGITEEVVMQGWYEPWIRAAVGRLLALDSIPGIILAGEFGLLTMTITYLLGLLLPLVLGFYLVMAVLEDSGYLPRLATLADRLMHAVGLNGRAVIPLILGLGCVQLGTVTTRLLGSRREKTIATVLLNLAIPCSAQIGVITGMLVAMGAAAVGGYTVVILLCLGLAGLAMDRVLPGRSSTLLIDLPPMRLPRPTNVMRKTGLRTWFFMKEATPWFLAGALVVTILQVSGGLELWQRILAPVTEGWLKLPREAATAFVMGLMRRDFGAAGLLDLALSPVQVVTALVVITLFVPCIASLMVLFKERGAREAALVWSGSWVVAFVVGGVVAQLAG